MASVTGLVASAGRAVYCASKFAVVGLTEALAGQRQQLVSDSVMRTTLRLLFLTIGAVLFRGSAWLSPAQMEARFLR